MPDNSFPETWKDPRLRHNETIDLACETHICAQGQNLGHMPRIYHICTLLKPKVIVETGIGAQGHGSSTYTFLEICREMGACLISIDTDNNQWFLKKFPDLDYKPWIFIQKRSVDAIKELDVRIDLLHLDSDHGTGYVTEELNAALPKMSEKHVMTTHDAEGLAGTAFSEFYKNHPEYTFKRFQDWHWQDFLTKNPELFKGLI